MNNIIYKIDRKTVKQLRKELEKTLNEFSKEHGIMVKLGNNVRFNDSEFRVKLIKIWLRIGGKNASKII